MKPATDAIGGTDGPEAVVLPGSRSPLDPARALRQRNPAPSKDEVREMQRGRLIDAAVQEVAEKGYRGAGVQSISRRAGVGYNTFYDYFDSKDALLLTAFQTGAESVLEAVGRAYADGDVPWGERVHAALSCLLKAFGDNPAFARFFSVEAQQGGPLIISYMDRAYAHALRLFGDAVPAPTLHMSAEELLPLAVAGISAGVSALIQSNREDELPELAEKLTAFVCTVFDGAESAGQAPAPSIEHLRRQLQALDRSST